MLQRLGVALAVAIISLAGLAGNAYAAENPDRDEVIIGTVLVALGTMLLLLLVYLIKWYFGLVRLPPPPEPDAHEHH